MPMVVPAPKSPSAPTVPPAKLDHTDTATIRRAMHGVTQLYPGAAGKLLAQLLLDWHEFGYRINQSALPAQLVDEVLARLPKQP